MCLMLLCTNNKYYTTTIENLILKLRYKLNYNINRVYIIKYMCIYTDIIKFTVNIILRHTIYYVYTILQTYVYKFKLKINQLHFTRVGYWWYTGM